MDQNVIDELNTLLEFVPADRLRKHITNLYFNYLQGEAIEVENSEDFKEMAGDIQFLLRFLDIANKPLLPAEHSKFH